jgi:hypothetical protein
MTHPEELLAGYVDGTLDGDDRADVAGHLASCARCAGEVAAARRARATLRALPTPVAPAEVGSRAIAESRAGGAPGSRAPAWGRWAAGIAAAAAVVLGLVVVVPNLGGGGEDAGTAGAGAEAADAPGGLSVATTVERVGDLAAEDLAAYASQARDLLRGAEEDGGAVAPEATDAGVEAASGDVAEAARCLRGAFPSLATDPVRLLTGSFEGTPAYVGVYLVASEPGADADVIQVIAAARRGCRVLSSAAAPVAP